MKEKKNIDRLFQEKFKDFEAQPTDRVWENIVAAQKEKDDRKVIPIWWKLGGIAAALILLFSIGTFLFPNDINSDNTPLVNTENPVNNASETDSNAITDASGIPNTTLQPNTENPVTSINDSGSSKNQEVAASGVRENNNQTNSVNTSFNVPGNTETNMGVTSTYNSPTYAVKSNKEVTSSETKYQDQNPSSSTTDAAIVSVDNTTHQDQSTDQDNLPSESDIIKEKDLVAEAEKIAAAQNEDILLPKEKIARDRWDVGAVAAPVYYSDFGGSGIDPQFKDNDKSGDINLSYGVQISYAVTPKLKVRTGVSNVDLSYSTNDLAFTTGGGGTRNRLDGVSYSQNGSSVSIVDASSRNELVTNDGFAPGASANVRSGSIQQRLSYIEVPMEAVYTISDKRFGVSVIGGVSTLLLNDNEVLLRSDDLNTSLGKSSSVNDVSFTTNLGLGLDYKITEDFKFNVEPALKYQINGYDDSVGEFKPYYLGVYTGFSYKF